MLGPEGKGVLTISGGLASFPRDASDTDHLLRRADEALLDAKKSGKNRIYLVGKPQSDIAEIR
jgi:PleD family two-component response regulator